MNYVLNLILPFSFHYPFIPTILPSVCQSSLFLFICLSVCVSSRLMQLHGTSTTATTDPVSRASYPWLWPLTGSSPVALVWKACESVSAPWTTSWAGLPGRCS